MNQHGRVRLAAVNPAIPPMLLTALSAGQVAGLDSWGCRPAVVRCGRPCLWWVAVICCGQGGNAMRPGVWRPPVEPSAVEQAVIKAVRRARLFVFLRQYRHEL